MLMDADNVILLAQCLSNKALLVCKFAIGYLGQDRGQRSLSAKKAKTLNVYAIYMVLSPPKDITRGYFVCISANKILNNNVLPCSTKYVEKKSKHRKY